MAEQFVEVAFPRGGSDNSREFSSQTPRTSADGKNVRTFETLEDRGRGGSRPGLTVLLPPPITITLFM